MKQKKINKRGQYKHRTQQNDCEIISSIKLLKYKLVFDENCYRNWLKDFDNIRCSDISYELEYDEDNVDSCLLGQGGNGFVLKYKSHSEKYAIKFLTSKHNRNEEVTALLNVGQLFNEKESANYRITRYFNHGDLDITIDGNLIYLYYIIMDLADGTIKDLMCSHKNQYNSNLETSDLLNQIKHISETVKVLHQSNFAHRDIKPENILLKANYPILSDFGLCGTCSEIKKKKGPKYWPNPEFVEACNEDLKEIDFKSDIFNLGCLFFYFFTGKYPIGQINLEQELQCLNSDIRDIIIKMIIYEKSNRLSDISEVVSIIDGTISNTTSQRIIE